MRQYIPGKNLQRATGPYTVLRSIANGAGVEIVNTRGRVIKAAKANLLPYRPPIAGQIDQRELNVSRYCMDSESDWTDDD